MTKSLKQTAYCLYNLKGRHLDSMSADDLKGWLDATNEYDKAVSTIATIGSYTTDNGIIVTREASQ